MNSVKDISSRWLPPSRWCMYFIVGKYEAVLPTSPTHMPWPVFAMAKKKKEEIWRLLFSHSALAHFMFPWVGKLLVLFVIWQLFNSQPEEANSVCLMSSLLQTSLVPVVHVMETAALAMVWILYTYTLHSESRGSGSWQNIATPMTNLTSEAFKLEK